MLVSFVVELSPRETLALSPHLGRAVHALFFEWLSAVDSQLAETLHHSNGPKPFTVSDLNGRRRRAGLFVPLDQGEVAWLRITTFSDQLSQVFLEQVIPRLLGDLKLAGHSFQILALHTTAAQHPWAGQIEYGALAQSILLARRPPGRRVELEFSSPTTFHQKSTRHQPLPLPELLIGNWLQKWNTFAPIGFPEAARPFASQAIGVNRFHLKSALVDDGQGKYVGCIGRCTYEILEADAYWLRMLHTLASFAFYCGSGHKTTQGLGQTRLVKR